MPMFAKILPFLSQIEFCPFLQDFDYFEMVAMTAMVANTPAYAGSLPYYSTVVICADLEKTSKVGM